VHIYKSAEIEPENSVGENRKRLPKVGVDAQPPSSDSVSSNIFQLMRGGLCRQKIHVRQRIRTPEILQKLRQRGSNEPEIGILKNPLTRPCDSCRKKRINCDSGTPKCNQCRKSGQACRFKPLYVFRFRLPLF